MTLSIVVAWTMILLESALSQIVWRAFLHRPEPSWDAVVRLALLMAVALLAWSSQRLRGLRSFVAAMVALAIGQTIRVEIEAVPPFSTWARTATLQAYIFADALLGVLPGALMVAAALLRGLRTQDIFLRVGDLSANTGLIPRRRLAWYWLVPVMTVLAGAALVLQLASTVHPNYHRIGAALASLPLAIAFATINAISEEVRFRCVLLATLVPTVGTVHALVMTSILFALGHWFSQPSGPEGVAMAAVLGLGLGWSILATRGVAFAWLVHAVLDVVILVSVALAA